MSLWQLRVFEEMVAELRAAEELRGSVHLAIGQEAVAVGACSVLEDGDPLFVTYRGHGWALARGVPARVLFAELLGRETGCNGGRGGSAYLSSPEHGFFGENSIVGGHAPIAMGAALAAKLDGSARVALCVFGDGALNQGAVHEAFNMSSAFDLPVVFICENNAWSELTAIEDMVGDSQLHRRAAGYGMPGVRVNGNATEEVQGVVAEALHRARGGYGPTLIEAMTQRLVGHYIGDAETYRKPGELEEARRHEPIAALTRELGLSGWTSLELRAVEAEVRATLLMELEQARLAPLGTLQDGEGELSWRR